MRDMIKRRVPPKICKALYIALNVLVILAAVGVPVLYPLTTDVSKVSEALLENAESDALNQLSKTIMSPACTPSFSWCDRSSPEPEIHLPKYCIGTSTGLAGAVAMSRFGDWNAGTLLAQFVFFSVQQKHGFSLTEEEKKALPKEGTAQIKDRINGDNFGDLMRTMDESRPEGCLAVSASHDATPTHRSPSMYLPVPVRLLRARADALSLSPTYVCIYAASPSPPLACVLFAALSRSAGDARIRGLAQRLDHGTPKQAQGRALRPHRPLAPGRED